MTRGPAAQSRRPKVRSRLYAALISGDLRNEENVHRAFAQAINGVLATNQVRPVAVAGAVHRLEFEVAAITQRTSAKVRVLWEGVEIVPPVRCALDPERVPEFVLHPQQDVAVHRVVVRAAGL